MPHPPDVIEDSDALYDEAPCGYVSHRHSDGMILRVNRTLADWLGQEPASLVGKRRFQDLLSAPARLLHESRHQVMLHMSGKAGSLRLEMLHADGSRLPALVTSRLKSDATGLPSWVRTNVFDATAHYRHEQALRTAREVAEQSAAEARRARAAADAANEAKSRFLAAMNHEFRTPINVISGFADLLTDPGAAIGEAERAEYMTEVRTAARHLLSLLQDATRYGGLDALQRSPGLRPLRIRDFLRDGIGMASEMLDSRGVEVSQLDGAEDPVVMANDAAADAVAGVLRDIAQRAPTRTALRAGVRTEAGGAAIVVWGSALSQSERALRGLMSPLEAPEVLRRGLDGSGLGIAFAHRVMHICGGSLALGASPDGGVAVTLSFMRPA